MANKLELTLIKTANKNKNGFINKIYVHIMCYTYSSVSRIEVEAAMFTKLYNRKH